MTRLQRRAKICARELTSLACRGLPWQPVASRGPPWPPGLAVVSVWRPWSPVASGGLTWSLVTHHGPSSSPVVSRGLSCSPVVSRGPCGLPSFIVIYQLCLGPLAGLQCVAEASVYLAEWFGLGASQKSHLIASRRWS